MVVRGKELLVKRPLRRVLKETKKPVMWICGESVQAHVRNQGEGPTENVDVCTQGRTEARVAGMQRVNGKNIDGVREYTGTNHGSFRTDHTVFCLII